MGNLKILTQNINYYVDRHGPWSVRRDMIADVIRTNRPDIVALQAVRKDPEQYRGIDQATQLALLLPDYRYVEFEAAARTAEGVAEGSAVLSRIPFTSNELLALTLLPNLDDQNHRVVMRMDFDLRFSSFSLFNAHFSWMDEQAKVNLKETLPFAEAVDGPALLVGDLNQPPESEVMRRFAAEGWTDAWQALCPGEPGDTFETGKLEKRIDYAWANQALRAKLKGIEIVGQGRHESGADISDHLGLLITLDISV